MHFQWNPGWNGSVSVVFVIFSSALALFVRRKWKLVEIRRAEVIRLMRLAAAEAERAEKEAAAFMYEVVRPVSALAGGGIGVQNCAVCQSPTATRCSRCKAVKYCSGNCQITHWRQGHKYECHPPPINDNYNDRPNVPTLKGADIGRPEVSSIGLEVEGKHHDANNDFYVNQSVSNMVEPQFEPYILVDNRSVSKVKSDVAKSLESSSTMLMSSDPNQFSEIHSGDKEHNQKEFVSTSENGGSSISILRSSSSFNDVLTRESIGHHSNTNVHDNLEESSSSGQSVEKPRTSLSDSEDVNLSTSAGAAEISASDSTCLFHETEFKPSVSSNMNFSSPTTSDDAKLCENVRELSSLGLSFNDPGKSKASNTSEGNCEHFSSDSGSIHQLQLDKGLHSELVDNLTSITCSSAPVRDRPNIKEIPVFENSLELSRENNNKQLRTVKDHSASIGHGQSFLGNGSQMVENILPFSNKSLKVDGSLPNGKVSSKKTVQLVTSSSPSRHSQSGLCNKGYGKYNYKIYFPYDDFIRLYNSDKVEMRPCGLINCGNSCYANAVLQCLAFTRPLAAFILEGVHAKACPKIGWCFTCEFGALLSKAKQGKSPLSPTGIISHIHDIGSNFGQGREEDAHEFLRCSIDAMQSVCLKEAGVRVANELAEETTLIQLVFGGYLRSKVKCLRCQSKSERRERMLDITVDIHGDIETLEEALARFTYSEILEGENKYRCDSCKSFERAKKQLTILEAPNVLTIALKRYQSGKYGKLNKTVHFPEYLNLAPYMRGSDDNSPVYRLYAVVVHNGHLNATFSGHYVCYVKNTQGQWFKADDSTVKQVEVQEVLSQAAYMLLYSRCSPRAPSFLRKVMTKKTKMKDCEHVRSSSNAPRFMFFRPGSKVGRNEANVPSNFEPRDAFDGSFRRRPRADSCSDCSSPFSCSDEGSSWSTESAKDSVTSEEFGDCPFGESGNTNIPRKPSFGESVYSNLFPSEGGRFRDRESAPFLYSVKHYNNLTEQRGGRYNADCTNSGEPPKSSVLLRRSGGDRRAQTFY